MAVKVSSQNGLGAAAAKLLGSAVLLSAAAASAPRSTEARAMPLKKVTTREFLSGEQSLASAQRGAVLQSATFPPPSFRMARPSRVLFVRHCSLRRLFSGTATGTRTIPGGVHQIM